MRPAMHPQDETIFALSSGRLPSAIAIIRISGAKAGAVLTLLAGRIPAPRVATRSLLRDADREPIDDALVLWFPGPSSATGEDVAELHVHGGRAVVAAICEALSAIDDVRPAEPGELTRRAFENGKLDLTEAEGLDDLVRADTDRQRRQALRQLTGLLGDRARDWRARIIEASAMIEAGIDFADEADVPGEVTAPGLRKAAALCDEIGAALAAGRGERLRDGLVVAIAGPPNVGKSTLMNQLARREVAIVSPHPGTTRDVIEAPLDLDGYPVTVIDTAGIRASDDPVEQEGVRRARARAAGADLVLWLTDAADTIPPAAGATPVWRVRNKIDLNTVCAPPPHPDADRAAVRSFRVSAARGDGIAELIAALTAFAEAFFGGAGEGLIIRARQRKLLQEAAASLQRSLAVAGDGEELAAEELRRAAYALGRLLGRVDVEDVLDVIFRDFCIGK